MRSNCGRILARSDGTSTADQIKQLDEASATPKTYPYWHQDGFKERNPPMVG